jgi:hypothetical protein
LKPVARIRQAFRRVPLFFILHPLGFRIGPQTFG